MVHISPRVNKKLKLNHAEEKYFSQNIERSREIYCLSQNVEYNISFRTTLTETELVSNNTLKTTTIPYRHNKPVHWRVFYYTTTGWWRFVRNHWRWQIFYMTKIKQKNFQLM